MHGIHQSRGRMFFEALCALAVSASFAGTWNQTGAPAILLAAAVALLYGLVRAFDMVRRRPDAAPPVEMVAAEPSVPFAAEEQVSPQPKAARKAGGRRKTAAKAARATQPAPVDEAMVTEPAPAEEATVIELVRDPDPEPVMAMPADEVPHAALAPLFEPEPFVRQQRTVFGRKSG
jgi:hypothetical protein